MNGAHERGQLWLMEAGYSP